MADTPVFYLFYGDDPLGLARAQKDVTEKMGDPAWAEMNLTVMDGRQLDEDALFQTANSLPFFVERRVVVLQQPSFQRWQGETARRRFLEFLDRLPETTALVFVYEDEFERREWKTLKESNWLVKWARAAGSRALVRCFQLPALRDMPEWVRQETRRLGGQILPEAAAALVNHVGNDTRMASQEIVKLLTYVDFSRAVEAVDVEELVAPGGQADVFAMVDALAAGDSRMTLVQIHRLLEEQDAIMVFSMIVRQFRMLLQTREILDEGGTLDAVLQEVSRVRFVAEKLVRQAQRFSIRQLEEIFHRLLEMDEAFKTSQMPPELAFDLLAADLARR